MHFHTFSHGPVNHRRPRARDVFPYILAPGLFTRDILRDVRGCSFVLRFWKKCARAALPRALICLRARPPPRVRRVASRVIVKDGGGARDLSYGALLSDVYVQLDNCGMDFLWGVCFRGFRDKWVEFLEIFARSAGQLHL